MMRLLIRRYVTAEQRKRDEFGITEDDVMEIRQDISTLRYELIDILRQNGMRTPTIDKQDAAREFFTIFNCKMDLRKFLLILKRRKLYIFRYIFHEFNEIKCMHCKYNFYS